MITEVILSEYTTHYYDQHSDGANTTIPEMIIIRSWKLQ